MKEFSGFIFSTIVVVCSFIVLDFIIGKALDALLDKVPNNGREIAHIHYSVKQVESPLLILGSSRAHHHYLPEVIGDSLRTDAYNLGVDGHFLSYNCALINTILDRYTPQAVMFEISLNEMFEYRTETDRTSSLHRYYYLNSHIKSVVDAKEGASTKYKMLLNTYRFNGSAIRIVSRWIRGGQDYDPLKGLSPLYTSQGSDVKLEVEHLPDKSMTTIVDYRVQLFENTLKRLKEQGVTVFCFDSPLYHILNPEMNKESERIMMEICSKYDIPFFDNRQLPEFLNHPEYFYDTGHLDYEGAKVYTDLVLKEIRSVGR